MKSLHAEMLSLLLVGCLAVAGCGGGEETGGGNTTTGDSSDGGKYKILDTRTDQFDRGRAKELVQDSIAKYPDLNCMVGLFAYNPPIMLDVVKEAGMLESIKLIGFDEADETLQGIIDGDIQGTVVQNPYKYGYESVRILAGLAKGDQSVLPKDGFLNIPARKITRDNVEEFWDELKKLTAPAKEDGSEKAQNEHRVAFVTNGIASFWDVAAKGALDAGREFKVDVEIIMPPEGAADQKRMVEDLLTKGIDGVAISPIDPDNQGEFLKNIAEKTNMITHDSDAPKSPRLCYVGMDNYEAGRMCGELVKEAMPDGANIMIFVGRLEQLNARLRQQGTIDEVLGKPKKEASDADTKTDEGENTDDDAEARQEEDSE